MIPTILHSRKGKNQGKEEMKRHATEDFQGRETILGKMVMRNTPLYIYRNL
jgi:hypothetical protein